MIDIDGGWPTLHARVEAWECDFNGHWNTRFYCRSFQLAAEVLHALGGDTGPDRFASPPRHIRFHRELTAGDAIEVRSFRLVDGDTEPTTAHVMRREGEIVATALDHGPPSSGTASPLPPEVARHALPRGLTGPAPAPWQPDPTIDCIVELGPVRREETDEGGSLRFDARAAQLATGSHHHVADLGYTHAFTRSSGIGRMLVELRHVPLGPCGAGEMLRMGSRLVSVGEKSWVSAHLLYTHAGAPVAVFHNCLLAVNMNTRRATKVPEIIRSAPIAAWI
jgi:acyl-CoA thioesterase FadM